jgi:hypothetical protein
MSNFNSKDPGYQNRLETLILKYQKTLETQNTRLIDRAYKDICNVYPPQAHMTEWQNQYYYLYDSAEDFTQDYLRIFCNVLAAWKPRGSRKKSRYDGSGEFKNYFIGALQHNYINLVKADNAGKRNPVQKCPICEKWVNPLSTHLRNHHIFLLWEQLLNLGHDINHLESCPVCKAFKIPKTYPCLINKGENCSGTNDHAECKKVGLDLALRKHMLSKHSSLLFNRFNEVYPNYQTVSPRALSVYTAEDEDGEEGCYYDKISDSNNMNNLLLMDLSHVEHLIMNNALNGISKIKFDTNIYDCTIDEFNKALDSLKNKMSLVGLER